LADILWLPTLPLFDIAVLRLTSFGESSCIYLL
jgi:hypothetical protein